MLVKIAATWEGIQAARELERVGIHCNLTLLFGLHQAAACADAKVTLISPFVGRILDWHKKDSGKEFEGAEDPGVQSVTTIYNYLKQYNYPTLVMGASFRNVEEIKQLAGCDLLTISPKLLAELDSVSGDLPRRLSSEGALVHRIERLSLDRETFESMHRENRMAAEQLTQGIEGFSRALVDLETLLAKRLTVMGENSHPVLAQTASGATS